MQSVLRQGKWAEIRVTEDGVCRLTGSDLQQLGLGPLPIPSSAVGIWGRNAGVLSEVNAATGEARDLNALPVRVEDGGDGALDAGDAVYFLGQAPQVWDY
ncbi:MAG: type secretion system sortase PorU, partial [Bacteroidota bacterium]